MPNGIVIVDKPEGWTSMDVCAKLRGIFHVKRVGHAGTLDPMATGVLPVFVGTATKAVQFAERGDKEYVARLKLGLVTNTQDTTGEMLETHPVNVSEEALRAVLPRFTGEISQIPPMYSAIKIGGKKLYELARKGEEIERAPRPVTIRRIELLEQNAADEFTLRVLCSKGTYIRTLCHDIGAALGCGGCMAALRRTMAAGFVIDEAVTLEQVQQLGEALLMPVAEFFRDYPAYTLYRREQEERAYHGNAIPAPNVSDGVYRVYDRSGNFLCLSRAENGTLHAIKNFFQA